MTEEKKITRSMVSKVETAIYRALRFEPFYGTISRSMRKIPTYDIPTAGVTVVNGRYVMYWNPDFMLSLDEKGRAGVVMHEIQHLIYGHINPDENPFIPPMVVSAMKKVGADKVSTKDEFIKKSMQNQMNAYLFKLWNVATDLAINSSLRDWLPYEEHQSLTNIINRLDSDEKKELKSFFKEDIFSLSQDEQDELEYLFNQNIKTIKPEEVEFIFSLSNGFTLENIKPAQMKALANTFIGPEFKGCFPQQKRTDWEDIDFNRSGVEYFDHIYKKQQDKSGSSEEFEKMLGDLWDQMNESTWDEHDGWGEDAGNLDGKEMAEKEFKSMVKDAEVQAKNSARGWGSVSSEFKQAIEAYLKPKIRWKKIVREFIHKSQRANRHSSYRSLNRRLPYLKPGRLKSRTSNLAIAIDMSGSVSNEEMEVFFSELRSLSDEVTFTVVPFDAGVMKDKVYVWDKNDKNKKVSRELCGGTNFQAVSDFIDDMKKFDGMIILTDLEAPAPKASRTQRMWISTRSNQFPSGRLVRNEKIITVNLKDYKRG